MIAPIAKQRTTAIDWESIAIEIVPIEEPNPHNPYSECSPELRRHRLQTIYQQIYARRIYRLAEINNNDRKNTMK